MYRSPLALLALVAISTGIAHAQEPEAIDLSKSRGLKILKDEAFFEDGYAESRRESLEILLEYDLRDTSTIDQFFEGRPKISLITKKHGQPDLIVYGDEKYEANAEPYWITHYFDRIGLVTTSESPDVVVFTEVQFFDYSQSNRRRSGKTFDLVAGTHNKIFYEDHKEVGRHVCNKDGTWIVDGRIPDGTYTFFHDGRKVAETSISADEGEIRIYYPSGSIRWKTQFLNSCFHGENRNYSEEGQLLIQARYENGVLNGESVEYDREGKVVRSQVFEDGKPIGSPEEATDPPGE